MIAIKERRFARRQADAVADVKDYRALFEEAVIAARAVDTKFSEGLVSDVLARFDDLERNIAAATTKSQIDTLTEQAAQLSSSGPISPHQLNWTSRDS